MPKILHYVWVGPKAMPSDHRRYVDGWRRIMPDWELRVWTDADIDWSVRYLQQAYATRGWNRISNYMRMHALFHHGGVYLDTDVEVVRPLDPLLRERAFLGFQSVERSSSWVNGAVFGAVPGHRFVGRLLRALRDEMPGWRRMGDAHGPGLITRLLEEEGLRHYDGRPQQVGGVTLLPVDYFYPYSWTERFAPTCVTPNTFAVHHWYGTVGEHRRLRPREMVRTLAALATPQLAAAVTRRLIEAERSRYPCTHAA